MSEEIKKEKSSLIYLKLKSLRIYKMSKTIMFFATHKSEVQTDEMIKAAIKNGKNVVMPVVDTFKNCLSAAKINSVEKDLKPCCFGIREPKSKISCRVLPNKIDLVIVPGIAFDHDGYRIGYGRGFYDSWLKNFTFEKRLGLAYDFQVTKRVPRNKNDVPLGLIVTEKRIIKTNLKGAR